ncbi:MAG TPA: D-arabinono-1,4-lactone oxidase [Myxococcaceae bacterium]|nr:D-arabinono-1,4-lactone oxidase [Myxococcaceae bacterium]
MDFLRALWRKARIFGLNTLNSLVFVLTCGAITLHEGRYRSWLRLWRNWNGTICCRPESFKMPETEKDLCDVIRDASRKSLKVRVAGGGHSFNASPATSGLLLSLDRYNKILRIDRKARVVRVQAGIRLRDLNIELKRHGLAFPVLGSTDTQSIGGLLATDLHGTGKTHGFLSEQVLSLRIVDAAGNAEDFPVHSEICRATIGALGTCGLVIEAELRCVAAFNLEKSSWLVQHSWIDEHIDTILQEYDHVSFYYIGGIGAEHVRMNVWRRTGRVPSPLLRLRKVLSELFDMAFSGYLLNLSRGLHRSRFFAGIGFFLFNLVMDSKVSIHPAATGFARKLFYLHDEIEYGIPRPHFQECMRELEGLLYRERLVAIVEVRFTPDTSQALLGPGTSRETCHIELAPSLTSNPEKIQHIFAQAERIFWRYGGQPHLGKRTPGLNPSQMRNMYGERFARFQRVRQAQDPKGMFMNDFTTQVFGEVMPAAARLPSGKTRVSSPLFAPAGLTDVGEVNTP